MAPSKVPGTTPRFQFVPRFHDPLTGVFQLWTTPAFAMSDDAVMMPRANAADFLVVMGITGLSFLLVSAWN